MAYPDHVRSAPRRGERQTLDPEDARQADDRRDTVRVLDGSLVLVVLAMAILGLYFGAAMAT